MSNIFSDRVIHALQCLLPLIFSLLVDLPPVSVGFPVLPLSAGLVCC